MSVSPFAVDGHGMFHADASVLFILSTLAFSVDGILRSEQATRGGVK